MKDFKFEFLLEEKDAARIIGALREVSNNYSELADKLLKIAIDQKQLQEETIQPETTAPDAKVVEMTPDTIQSQDESNG